MTGGSFSRKATQDKRRELTAGYEHVDFQKENSKMPKHWGMKTQKKKKK